MRCRFEIARSARGLVPVTYNFRMYVIAPSPKDRRICQRKFVSNKTVGVVENMRVIAGLDPFPISGPQPKIGPTQLIWPNVQYR